MKLVVLGYGEYENRHGNRLRYVLMDMFNEGQDVTIAFPPGAEKKYAKRKKMGVKWKMEKTDMKEGDRGEEVGEGEGTRLEKEDLNRDV